MHMIGCGMCPLHVACLALCLACHGMLHAAANAAGCCVLRVACCCHLTAPAAAPPSAGFQCTYLEPVPPELSHSEREGKEYLGRWTRL
jgi:hypothetical protein